MAENTKSWVSWSAIGVTIVIFTVGITAGFVDLKVSPVEEKVKENKEQIKENSKNDSKILEILNELKKDIAVIKNDQKYLKAYIYKQ